MRIELVHCWRIVRGDDQPLWLHDRYMVRGGGVAVSIADVDILFDFTQQ